VVIELWAVDAFVFRLLLLVLRKELLCAFLSLIFLCGMMPFFMVGVLPMLGMQVETWFSSNWSCGVNCFSKQSAIVLAFSNS
jgi:hypothetical protein